MAVKNQQKAGEAELFDLRMHVFGNMLLDTVRHDYVVFVEGDGEPHSIEVLHGIASNDAMRAYLASGGPDQFIDDKFMGWLICS